MLPTRVLAPTLLLISIASCASAGPIVWNVSGTFTDGGTLSGSFTFNPDTGTACSTGSSPCGTFSNVDIVTTLGTLGAGATYTTVCGVGDPSCTGLKPDSTEVLFLTSSASNQNGDPALAFRFTGTTGVPPAGLTDAGGVINISSSSSSVGAVEESLCSGATCSSNAPPERFTNAGTASSAPEPSTWTMLLTGLGALALVLRRRAHPVE